MEDEERRRRREAFARLASDPDYFRAEAAALEREVQVPVTAEDQDLRDEVQQLRAEVQQLRDEVRRLSARLDAAP